MGKTAQCVLLVDDEPDILELLTLTLRRMGLATLQAASVEQARELLDGNDFDLCLTDLRLPDGSGIEIVEHIQQARPGLPVAVISAHGNMQTAIDAMKAGAFDFVSKPIDLQQLRALVEGALALRPGAEDGDALPELLGRSPAMQAIKQQIIKLARSMAPVHIHGESGTGKELVARMIHAHGPRREHPFLAINCSAIPAELVESELFGHKKGSFTGATADKPGLFQAADGGTLLLDEIADLPLTVQAKLLRAIQERAVRPVGGHAEIPINVRILSATHQDLRELVRERRFREDLFYRINVIQLDVPALRERREDIPLLTDHILGQIAARNGTAAMKLRDSGRQALADLTYPGNIRELENILERAVALGDGESLDADDLDLPDTTPLAAGPEDLSPGESLDDFISRTERRLIEEALRQNRYNKTRTADQLGISFRSLRYKLKKLGIGDE